MKNKMKTGGVYELLGQPSYFIRTNSGTSVQLYGLLLLTLYVLNNPFVPFVKTHNLRHIFLLVNYLNGGPFCSKFHRRRSNFLAHGMIWRFLKSHSYGENLLMCANLHMSRFAHVSKSKFAMRSDESYAPWANTWNIIRNKEIDCFKLVNFRRNWVCPYYLGI